MRKHKLLLFIITFVLLITLWHPLSINASETPAVSDEAIKDYLITLGTPEEYIATLSSEKLNSMYSVLQSGNYVFSDWEQKVVEIEDSVPQMRGNISTSKLQLIISTYDKVVDGVVDQVYVSLGFRWLQTPIMLETDALTFNWDGSLFSINGFYSINTSEAPNHPVVDYVEVPAKSANGGVGWYMRLSDKNFGYVGTNGGAELLLIPKRTIGASENLNSDMHFNYAHSTVGLNLSFGVSGSGLSAGVSINSGVYDEQALYYVYH